MKKVWSRAAKAREPRQIREEAAVSELLRVPRGSRTGANYLNSAWEHGSKVGARPNLFEIYSFQGLCLDPGEDALKGELSVCLIKAFTEGGDH